MSPVSEDQVEDVHILHVDDEPDFADLVATFLEREDDRFEIETATDPEEALERLDETAFDCLVSDYDMPGRNGIALLEAVRETYPDLPFILYTGKGSEEIASDAISAGVTDYLQKESGTSQYTVLMNRISNAVEKYRAQTELADREQRLNLFFEQSPLGVIEWDENFELVRLNDAAEGILGYTERDLAGRTWKAIVPESDREAVDEVVSNLLEDTGGYHSINDNVRKDGERIVCEWHNHVVTDDDGDVVAIFSQFQDRTDRTDREREHERVLSLLDHVQRIADVGGWEVGPRTREVFWSDHLFEMLDWEGTEEPPLDEALDVYVEADRARVESAIEDALAAGTEFTVEARFRRSDGDVRRFEIRGEPVIEDGSVASLRGAVHDITDRRRRERVLRELYEIISDRHRSFESQIQALLAFGRTELGTEYGTLSRIRGDEYLFEFVDADDDSVRAGDVVPVSATNCDIVASTQRTVVLGNVERDAPSETDRAGFAEWGISCYIGAPLLVEDDVYGTFCFYDTEPRGDQFSDWEETLVDLMSSWVSKELQQRRANERLQEQNARLEQFVSVVSHDLRNPLNVAAGRLEIARTEHDSEQLDRVARAHERMEGLIDDPLTLARHGEQLCELAAVDVAELVDRCWDHVETGEATRVTEADRSIRADPGRVQQLVENLFRNAVEHGSTSGRTGSGDAAEHADETVTITVGELADGFYIEDDGPGIPDEHRDDVFAAGFSTSDDGTGFGLSIVERICRAHGWTIRVTESAAGGARFEITDVEFAAE